MKKSFMAIFTAAAIAVSGLGSTMAYASVFADINSVPWPGAAQYIDEAYDLGLMAGYVENGKRYCKPKNNITYCEAAQLMYAIMSSYSGTSVSSSVVSKWTNVMASKNIPSWAYNAVAYSLENSILSQNDISIFMASSSKQNNARREDVAVIFGKALSKIHGLTSNPTLSYADKSGIAATSVPYVELLNRLNIMIGDANNKFNPKVNINRAEMSVIVSKTYNNLKGGTTGTVAPPSGAVAQYSGTINSIKSTGTGSYAITIKTDKGSNAVVANAATTVIGVDGGTSSISKLKTGAMVVAVCSGSTAATIIIMSEGSGTTAAAETFKGKLSAVSTSEISVKGDSKTKTFDISDDVDVKIEGSTSTLAKLISKFKGGYNYTVTVSLDDDEEVIAIDAKEGDSDSKLDDDAIVKISSSKITLNSGDILDLPDDTDDVDVKIDGNSDKDFDDLKEAFDDLDDEEQMIVDDYELNDDDELEEIEVVIEEIESDDEEESEVEGVIDSISSSYVKISGTKYYFPDDDDDVEMEFDGDDDYDEISEFVDDVDSAIDDDDVIYAEITMKGEEISEIVASKCDEVVEGEIDSIDGSDIEVDGEELELASDAEIKIIVGDSAITSEGKLEDAVMEDEMVIEVKAIVVDDEVIVLTGYVKEIEDASLKSLTYSSTDTKCYIKLNVDAFSTSVKIYFADDPDISGEDCSDLEDFKDYIDDDDVDDVTVSIELDEEGKITDLTIE